METPYDRLDGSVSVNGMSPSAIYRQGYEAGKRESDKYWTDILKTESEAAHTNLAAERG